MAKQTGAKLKKDSALGKALKKVAENAQGGYAPSGTHLKTIEQDLPKLDKGELGKVFSGEGVGRIEAYANKHGIKMPGASAKRPRLG